MRLLWVIEQHKEPLNCSKINVHVSTIVRISQITTDQVSGFTEEAQKFNRKFKEEGPASVGTDLDKGILYLQVDYCV